jgi:hypothetical protein
VIELVRYDSANRSVWDDFVAKSKNGAFLFERDYQDYHCDRFPDNSFMFYMNGELRALLPACRIEDEISSHGGLTFGGVISDSRMTTPVMMEIFDAICLQIESSNVRRLVYKPSPKFYHNVPAEEDLYAIVQRGGRLFRRDIGSILCPQNHPKLQDRRSRAIKRARGSRLEFAESDDLSAFWEILEAVLATNHGAVPTHSLTEIEYLHSRFPNRIRLFAAFRNKEMLGGTVVYDNPTVAHTQYIASSPEGYRLSALDFVFSELVTSVYHDKPWISFGISTESGGTVLNRGLIEFKEGFGARACAQDFYELLF